MTAEFESLAKQTLSYLCEKHPQHPATSHTLLDPDEMPNESLWNKKECGQLFDCINHVIYSLVRF